jgi:hypothetical protein
MRRHLESNSTLAWGGFALAVGLIAAPPAAAQVQVVNMVPASNSGETARDAEPSLAGDPANPSVFAGSAFTPDPGGTLSGVVYVSTNGGTSWSLTTAFIPGSSALSCITTFCDISLRFAGTSSRLYIGNLTASAGISGLNVGRVDNITAAIPTWTAMESRPGVSASSIPDQPWVTAATVLEGTGFGTDHVYVTVNDQTAGTRTADVDLSLNPTPPAPSGFSANVVEQVATCSQDAPAVRSAAHLDGTVYAAFTRWTGTCATGDVVVVRDDNWGAGATPFQALHDAVIPAQVGERVVTGVGAPGGNLGNQRINNTLAIAVDPSNSDIVYLAWTDGTGPANITIHVRRSIDRGVHWSGADLFSVATATNPALAINSQGKVALLYQRLQTVAGVARWRTHIERTTNAFTATQDVTLADTPATAGTYGGFNAIGDYDGLISLGKDFYGIFSALNTADNANFPNGVTYQRFANFTTHQLFANAAMTASVGDSIDPYFFHVTELASDQDFYVRDWNNTTTDHDNGQEPSTSTWFWITSDIWNRASNTPGAANASGWFPTDPMQAGTGPGGDNWGFARVRRNATGSAATVTLHFLVSPFGTGSNFQDAGTDPDPTLSFAAADSELTMTAGYPWHQDPTASTHACIAAQISTTADPMIPPGLAGTAPGWPSGVAIVEDNNKAQRNLDVNHNLADTADVSYALVHNAATIARDIQLRASLPAQAPGREVEVQVVGGGTTPVVNGGTVTLAKMQPGENRWVGIRYRTPARGNAIVAFDEIDRGRVVNGFALETRAVGLAEAIAANLKEHAQVFGRIAASLKAEGAEAEAAAARGLGARVEAAKYLAFMKDRGPRLEPSIKALLAARGVPGSSDPFGLRRGLGLVGAAVANGDTTTLVSEHATLLRKLDAAVTAAQKAGGDPADIAQMVRWQAELFKDRASLKRLPCAKRLVEESLEFVQKPRRSRERADSYPELLKEVRSCLAKASAPLEKTDPALGAALAGLDRAPRAPAPLQSAHRAFLLRLSSDAR